MRKFQVTVNGQSYIVDVEELGASASIAPAPAAVAAPVAAPAPVAAAPAPTAAPAPAAPVAAVGTAPAGSETIKSPMPGTILKVLVAQGASVKKGDNLAILEAMKMENEIKSPRDGVVAAILVTPGSTVSPGDALIAIS